MAQGLQVFDASGLAIVDTDTMLPRSIVIGQITDEGQVTILPINSGLNIGVPIVAESSGSVAPEVSFSGSTLRWSRQNGNAIDAYLAVMLL